MRIITTLNEKAAVRDIEELSNLISQFREKHKETVDAVVLWWGT